MNAVHVELLLGRRVVDPTGRVVGRIRGIYAVRDGAHCFVKEYHLGTAALLSRLGISSAGLIGLPLHRDPKRVPWQFMDLTDPDHPRLTVSLEEILAVSCQGTSAQVSFRA